VTLKQANALIDKWQPILAPEWDITVKPGHGPDQAPNDCYASIDRKGDGAYLRATLYLGDTIDKDARLDTKNRKRVLLHELLHLTLSDLDSAGREPTKLLGNQEGNLARNVLDWQLERAVDRLAVAFVTFA
jgi:hypothetical protein